MPFVHLERELWDLRDATGQEIGPDAPERRAWLLDRGAVGRLRPPVEHLLADPRTLAAASRLLPGPALHPGPRRTDLRRRGPQRARSRPRRKRRSGPGRPRRRGFAEEVLRAYAYQCAMCGFDGALGRLHATRL
jgi:putative restriction endonuclease